MRVFFVIVFLNWRILVLKKNIHTMIIFHLEGSTVRYTWNGESCRSNIIKRKFPQEVISLLGFVNKPPFPLNTAHTCYVLKPVSLLLKSCGKHTFPTWRLYRITYWVHTKSPWLHIQTNAAQASSCKALTECVCVCEVNYLMVLSSCNPPLVVYHIRNVFLISSAL